MTTKHAPAIALTTILLLSARGAANTASADHNDPAS